MSSAPIEGDVLIRMPVSAPLQRRLRSPQRAFRFVVPALALALVAAACSGSPSTSGASSATGQPSSSATPATRMRLAAALAPWHLDAALSRPVVLADAGRLVVAGGLQAGDRSLASVASIDPTSGKVVTTGHLSTAVHDAAGAVLASGPVVFGGGSTLPLTTVQTAQSGRGHAIGNLPRPRADLSSTTVNGVAYLLGGYDGTVADRSVLSTTDGQHFSTIATLPVGVRYGAVAAVGSTLWVFGGESNGVPVALVQRVDLSTGAARVVGHLPRPISHASAVVLGDRIYLAGGQNAGGRRLATVWSFDPSTHGFHPAGRLPYGVSDAGAAVVDGAAYLVGGETPSVTRQVIRLNLVSAPAEPAGASPSHNGIPAAPATQPAWLPRPRGPGHLAPGSDPSVLPGPILIADKYNNRLVIVDPQGRVRWSFPRKGDLPPGETFLIPDDAFFSPDGTQIIATEEDDFVVSVIDVASHQLIYRYGDPGHPGSGPNQLNNPDDAFLLPNHDILTPDIKNCRILRIRQGAHRPAAIYGTTGSCYHGPPSHFGSPNGAFPLRDGNFLVTEIQGGWVDEMTPHGKVLWSLKVPGVYYPSDTNQLPNGHFVTVDYSTPGQVVVFGRHGHVFWRYAPQGAQTLRQPSLARPLPNGDILVTDDANHRVIVVDPRTNRVVWQYGHLGVAGRGPGYLNHPDGLDLLPPNQLASLLLRPSSH